MSTHHTSRRAIVGPALSALLVALLIGMFGLTPPIAALGSAQDADQPAGPADPSAEPPAEEEPPTGDPADPDQSVATGRLSGADRIETAIAIAQRGFPDGAPVVYLANAQTMVDAIAAGSLADGPILLVGACDLPSAVADELARLQPSEVLALGGPAAVCDEVLAAAADAAEGEGIAPGDRPDAVVTAEVAVIDASSQPPFSTDVTDPGVVYEGAAFAHTVTFTATTDAAVALDDPRFSAVMRQDAGQGEGQMVVTGRGCGPNRAGDSDEVVIACTDDFLIVQVHPGQPAETALTLHTADEQVGSRQLLPGTYVLDQPVRWDTDSVDGEVDFDDGQAVIRITYTVRQPDGGSDTPDDSARAIVEWQTPEGTFRTSGHSAADLERIREGVETSTHIGIPNGAIHRGDGGVNIGHEWHVTGVELADMTMEVCDGTADYVDEHLEDFLAIGRYCPWGAVPISIS